MKKSLMLTFWALVGVFVLIASEFCIPALGELFRGPLLFLLPFIIFSLLGATLVFLTIKEKVGGNFKKFLILTGTSSAGIFVSIFLHNAFYGLGIITSHIAGLSGLMEVLHVAFFLIAIFLCPIGFLVGVVGSVVLFIREKKKEARKDF